MTYGKGELAPLNRWLDAKNGTYILDFQPEVLYYD